MTNPRQDNRTDDLRTSGSTPLEREQSGGGLPGWLIALLALLALVVIALILFFALGGDADVATEPGSVDVETPDADVDVDAPDVDVEAPDVDVDPGDIDVEDGDADANVDE